jgi:hypothetical protein
MGLVAKHTVDPGNGLDNSVASHGLVKVEGVQTWDIRDHRHGVELEELRNVVAVVGKLIEGVLHCGAGIPGILQLEDSEWQSVDEDHKVGTPIILAPDWELIDHQELVSLRPIPVDGVHVFVLHPATGMLDTDFDPACEGLVERHVPAEGVDPLGRGDASERFVNCVRGQIRVLPGQEGPQAIAENNLLKWAVKLDAMDAAIAETLQPLDGRKLELGFAAPVGHEPVGYPE